MKRNALEKTCNLETKLAITVSIARTRRSELVFEYWKTETEATVITTTLLKC